MELHHLHEKLCSAVKCSSWRALGGELLEIVVVLEVDSSLTSKVRLPSVLEGVFEFRNFEFWIFEFWMQSGTEQL